MSNYSSDNAKMKVGVVDDSPLVRAIIKDVVNATPGMCVVGEAEDPYKAREMIKTASPDVITLDIEMPRMNGIEFLQKIMSLRPMPVLMVSTLTQKGAEITLQALEMGALDYVAKPLDQGNAEEVLNIFKRDLIHKLKQVRLANVQDKIGYEDKPAAQATKTNNKYDLIAIASSTGGVERLRYMISKINANIPPIAIVQHINSHYVENLCTRMQAIAPPHIKVKIAQDLEKLEPNTIYFADNIKHLTLRASPEGYKVVLNDDPPLNGFKASADYLFKSIAKNPNQNVLGLVLSGMGNDGANGLLTLKDNGCKTVGENEKSCLVYGMSKAASQIGALSMECTIQDIAKIINDEKDVP